MSEGLTSHHCLRCGGIQGEHFCPNCGQPAKVARLRFGKIIVEFFDRLFGVNSMFMRTMVHLFTKPGKVAAAYINGDRRSYLGPVAYFVIVTTIYLSYIQLTDFDIYRYSLSINPMLSFFDDSTKHLVEENKDLITKISIKFHKLPSLILTFFNALALWLIYRKSQGLNYVEQLAAALYVTGQLLLFEIIASLIPYSLFGYSNLLFTALVNFLIFGWLTSTQYTLKPSLLEFFKGLLARIMGQFLLALGVVILIIVFLVL